ncbi:hypothetical protein L596_012676 [Steinernema carpocapsae]|uniref:C-type lectin domain-containing protein n=1 Tax=Steinernema carpocapsae TaxID=34508 RepID=A0A4V6A4V1_STECR|nr:hypothetical protein L596_012676 [Steinernema carpocapsae]
MKTFNVILLFSTIFLVSCQTCSNCSYCEQSKLQTSVLLANCVKNLPITVANEEWKACEIEEPNTCHEELIVLTKMLAKCMGKKCVQVWHLSLLSRPLVNQLLLRPPHSTPQRKPQPLLLEGHLASVHSDEELDFVGKLVGSRVYKDGPWPGGRRDQGTTEFKWSDGTAFDFKAWKSGLPSVLRVLLLASTYKNN